MRVGEFRRPAARVRHVVLAGGVVLGSLLLGGLPSARADQAGTGQGNTNTFNLAAEGDALQVGINDQSLPLVPVISASPYGASASVSSIGQSTAAAGAPYVPFAPSLPGTINGLANGALPPLPPVPGYVSSNYPSVPTQSQLQSGYEIASTSDQYESAAKVNIGIEQAGANRAQGFSQANASANGDGSVTASASAGIDLLNLGGILDIGNVSSTETMEVSPGAGPSIKGTTSLGSITLLTLPVGLQGDALGALGFRTPFPLSQGLIPVLNTALAPVGLKLVYLPKSYQYTDGSSSTGDAPDRTKTVAGITSGALEIDNTEDVPSQGKVQLSYVVARVSLSASDTAGFAPGQPGESQGSGGSGTDTNSSGSDLSGSNSGGPVSTGLAADSSGQTTGMSALPAFGGTGNPAASPSLGTTSGGPTGSIRQSEPTPLALLRRAGLASKSSAEGIYLLILLSGGALLGGSLLVRFLGIRLAASGVQRSRPLSA